MVSENIGSPDMELVLENMISTGKETVDVLEIIGSQDVEEVLKDIGSPGEVLEDITRPATEVVLENIGSPDKKKASRINISLCKSMSRSIN